MTTKTNEQIEISVDGVPVDLNPFVRGVLREVNLGILKTLTLPVSSPQQFQLKLKLNLPDKTK